MQFAVMPESPELHREVARKVDDAALGRLVRRASTLESRPIVEALVVRQRPVNRPRS